MSIRQFILAVVTGIFLSATPAASADIRVDCPGLSADVTFRPLTDNQLQVSVLDAAGDPVGGLGTADFTVKMGQRTAKILSVESILTETSVGLTIVLVVDNSSSMKQRKAIGPLIAALDGLLEQVRPIDRITMIVFDEKNRLQVGGRSLRLARYASSSADDLKDFLRTRYDDHLTDGTYLNDAMFAGIETVKELAPDGSAFLVVFSDGEEINSTTKRTDVESAAGGADFTAYAVDYMPKPQPDPFLEAFTTSHNGKVWKAGLASELSPIFQAVSTTMFQRYIVTYRFFDPPQGGVVLEPETIRIEDVTAIDSSPLLNHVFFDTDRSEIPDRYALSDGPEQAESFDADNLKDTMDKYRHVLDVIGKRLKEHPEARMDLVGCNADVGREKNRIDLSRARAEAVAGYLQHVWGVDRSRIGVSARNLPAAPSSSREPDGRVENQRVELYSDHPAVLATVNSNYVQKMSPSKAIRIRPDIAAEAGIDNWRIVLKGDGETVISKIEGYDRLPEFYDVPLDAALLDALAFMVYVNVGIQVVDSQGEVLADESAAVSDIAFERREEILAKRKGQKVFEKYALILFDFDSSRIKDRNKSIVDRILARIGELSAPRVTIAGHTDTIGSEEYNLKLSERRAKAVYDTLTAELGAGVDVNYAGLGEDEPIYDNGLPEGRALNRTVTVLLEYEINPVQ